MTIDQTREKFKIAQYARIISWVASDIHDFDNIDTTRRLCDVADLAEELAEDARKLAADLQDEVKA
jgi:hypothetical protein